MGRPRLDVPLVAVRLAVAARRAGGLPVTAVDVATDLGISRSTLHRALVRQTRGGFAAFLLGFDTFCNTPSQRGRHDAGMVDLHVQVPAGLAPLIEAYAADDARRPAGVPGRHGAVSSPGGPPR